MNRTNEGWENNQWLSDMFVVCLRNWKVDTILKFMLDYMCTHLMPMWSI